LAVVVTLRFPAVSGDSWSSAATYGVFPCNAGYGNRQLLWARLRREEIMHEAVRIIEDEHRSIAAVLHGLTFLAHDIRDRGATPDHRVLHAMLDYIVAFPEKLHHPKEDRYLFARLRERDPGAVPLIEKLQAEHVRGNELIKRLQNELVAYVQQGPGKAKDFARAVDQYADFHWAHMRCEESELLPRAEKALTEADWQAIAAAFKENDDPLFGIKPKEEFEQLFHRVVQLAPPPIGVGPEKHA
jgi:hemerythrin-like domain-containing protein